MASNLSSVESLNNLNNNRYSNLLRSRRELLEKYLDVPSLIYNQPVFKSYGVDEEKALKLAYEESGERAVRYFLNKLSESKDKTCWGAFVQTLQETEQDLVLEILENGNSEIVERHELWSRQIEPFRGQIIEQLDPITFSQHFLSKGILQQYHAEKIEAVCTNRGRTRAAFMMLYMIQKRADWYPQFLRALFEENQKELVREIDDLKLEKFEAEDRDRLQRQRRELPEVDQPSDVQYAPPLDCDFSPAASIDCLAANYHGSSSLLEPGKRHTKKVLQDSEFARVQTRKTSEKLQEKTKPLEYGDNETRFGSLTRRKQTETQIPELKPELPLNLSSVRSKYPGRCLSHEEEGMTNERVFDMSVGDWTSHKVTDSATRDSRTLAWSKERSSAKVRFSCQVSAGENHPEPQTQSGQDGHRIQSYHRTSQCRETGNTSAQRADGSGGKPTRVMSASRQGPPPPQGRGEASKPVGRRAGPSSSAGSPPTDSSPYVCVCGETLRTNDAFKKHGVCREGGMTRRPASQNSARVYGNPRESLEIHRRSVPTSSHPAYGNSRNAVSSDERCRCVCGKEFNSRRGLHIHMSKMKHGAQEKFQ